MRHVFVLWGLAILYAGSGFAAVWVFGLPAVIGALISTTLLVTLICIAEDDK